MASDNDWSSPKAMAIPKEGYFTKKEGRFGPVFPRTLNVRSVIAVLGTGGIRAGVVFLAVGFFCGWALGGSSRETWSVLGLGTAQRNIAAAVVVANQSFDDPNVVVMVVVIAIVGLVTLMPLARALGRRVPAAMSTPL